MYGFEVRLGGHLGKGSGLGACWKVLRTCLKCKAPVQNLFVMLHDVWQHEKLRERWLEEASCKLFNRLLAYSSAV